MLQQSIPGQTGLQVGLGTLEGRRHHLTNQHVYVQRNYPQPFQVPD